MSASPQPSSTDRPQDPESTGFVTKFLRVVERIGNRLPDPTYLFVGALALSFLASFVLAGTEYEVTTAAGGTETRSVQNQLTGSGLAHFLAHLVETFTSFHPIGVVLVAMLGLGVAERAGYIGAGLKLLLQITPRQLLTPVLALVAIVSHTGIDAGYVIVIPVGGILFFAVGRHPLAGIAAAFAGVSGGFSANFIPSALDPLLQSFTESAGKIVDPELNVNPLCNWAFAGASSVFLIGLIWFITDAVVEPRLRRDVSVDEDHDAPALQELTSREVAGFLWGSVTAIGLLGLLALWAWPEESPLRDADGRLDTFRAPLTQAIVPILFVVGLTPGLVHGYISGSIKKANNVVEFMTESMAGMGHYLVIMFFCAQFLAVFNASKIGEFLAISGADVLRTMNPNASVLLVGMILIVGFVNLLVGSASAKWALLSVILVPMMMKLGYSPALTQSAYRVGDSTTNIITPLMPYFPLVVTYCQRYVKTTGIGTLISMMLPFSISMLLGWTAFLLLYWSIGFPLGIDGGYEYLPG